MGHSGGLVQPTKYPQWWWHREAEGGGGDDECGEMAKAAKTEEKGATAVPSVAGGAGVVSMVPALPSTFTANPAV